MTVRIGRLGWWSDSSEYAGMPSRALLPTSRGTTLVVLPEFNNPNPYSINPDYGDGSGTHTINIYEVSEQYTLADAELVASIPVGWQFSLPTNMFAADLMSDDSVALVYQQKDQSIKYRTVTYGTWDVGPEVNIYSGLTDSFRLDVTVSDNDAVAVGALKLNSTSPKLEMYVFLKSTLGGWSLAEQEPVMFGVDPNPGMADIALQFVHGTSALVIATTAAQTAAREDWGMKLWSSTVDEAAATMTPVEARRVYLQGDMTTKAMFPVRRVVLFPSGDGEVTVAYMQAINRKSMLVTRIEWDGTTWNEVIAPQEASSFMRVMPKYRFAASYVNDTINFYYVANVRGVPTVINHLARIDRDTGKVHRSGHFKWDGLVSRKGVIAGTGRNADIAPRHAVVHFLEGGNGGWHSWLIEEEIPDTPQNVMPSAGAQIETSEASLSLNASLKREYPQTLVKAIWQFAEDASFATNVITYTQSDNEYQAIRNTNEPNQYKRITDTLPATDKLSQGTWFVRAAVVSETGLQSPWSSAQSFTVSHAPAATALSPANSSIRLWQGGEVLLSWNFTDPYSSDQQTAFQVQVLRSDDDTVIYDSGTVASVDTFHTVPLPIEAQDVDLYWRVRLWDSDNVVGIYSDPAFFMMVTQPTVAVSFPAASGVIESGIPRVTFTPTVPGGRQVVSFRVFATQGNTVVYDSGDVYQTIQSGEEVTHNAESPVFGNNEAYTIQMYVVDSALIRSNTDRVSITTSWVPPATPSGAAVDIAPYSQENAGYVAVLWEDNNRDADFTHWEVHRKDDIIDGSGAVSQEGKLVHVGSVFDIDDFYEYRDYMAPSGYKTTYNVVQVVDRFGDTVRSENNEDLVVYPRAEGYWLVDPEQEDIEFTALRLSNVTSDSYTDEYEEESFHLVGRGRHVDQGDRLGYSGSLNAQLRDTHGTTARQKKIRLEDLKRESRDMYLRTPFGDMFVVHIGSLQVSRIAGVGTSEFCDVSIPYSEVAE